MKAQKAHPFRKRKNAVYGIVGCESEPHQKMFANQNRKCKGTKKVLSTERNSDKKIAWTCIPQPF